ncbi:hypothetical protein HELRODRAFT_77319 [Helobdella robusta]|uniref:Glutathione transferase n=1 Tax=Helobdella robusta TaxID=6412 RepID=T1G2W1_HELRO|nr:hypothetical protein HELRODRAFT_77319 [Helobdella robusta]ESO05481.1 hypothetical protein HELRODRAFT_77319 [Helobdella robusta]
MGDEVDPSKPILTYFNGRGRAEIIRLIFNVANVPYEDKRISKEEWQSLKPSTPFGQLPLLTMDNVVLCQSNTIARFLAKKYGLAGANEMENALCDMVVDCVEDALKPVLQIFFEKDDTKKLLMFAKFEREQLPVYMAALEKLLVSNRGEDGYFVGDNLTWADITVMNFREYLTMINVELSFGKYPIIATYIDRIAAVPKIAEWIDIRPKTDL